MNYHPPYLGVAKMGLFCGHAWPTNWRSFLADKPHGGKRAGAGRKQIGPAPLLSKTITLSTDDIAYLQTLNENLSAAIRQLIAQSRL